MKNITSGREREREGKGRGRGKGAEREISRAPLRTGYSYWIAIVYCYELSYDAANELNG